MTAPRSRSRTRVRSQVKAPERPLRNDLVTIFATFKAEGPFQIAFATYRKVDGSLVTTDRFPTLALAVLRTQLLAVHGQFWLTAKLPVNPTVVNDHLFQPGTNTATHRREYVKLLCEWFNAACKQQNVRAVMVIGRPPQPKPKKSAMTPPDENPPAKKSAKARTAKKATKKAPSKRLAR